MAVCAIVSFRLGLSDGVSIVAAAWQQALEQHGWRVVTVAGEGPVDHLIPGLAIGADADLSGDLAAELTGDLATELTAQLTTELIGVLAGADVVLVENMLSIPMNLPASRALAAALAGRPAVLHHHDPAWQRSRYAHITELPPRDPQWRHVTINHLTQRQFESRGFEALTIYNGFDPNPPPGNRAATRSSLGLGDDQLLAAHPVRAIERKNIPGAVEICERHGLVYWLPNPAEEGYDQELERVLDRARCPVLRSPVDRGGLTMADLYAACDLVLFPSTWEGFGNPPVEAALHRRPVVVGHYPVAEELRELGFHWIDPDDADTIANTLAETPNDMLDRNQRIAREHLSVEQMSSEVKRLFESLGGQT